MSTETKKRYVRTQLGQLAGRSHILIVYVMRTLPVYTPFAEIDVAQQTGCDQNGEHNECSAPISMCDNRFNFMRVLVYGI